MRPKPVDLTTHQDVMTRLDDDERVIYFRDRMYEPGIQMSDMIADLEATRAERDIWEAALKLVDAGLNGRNVGEHDNLLGFVRCIRYKDFKAALQYFDEEDVTLDSGEKTSRALLAKLDGDVY